MKPTIETGSPSRETLDSGTATGRGLSAAESRSIDTLRLLCVLCIVPLHCTVAHRIPAPLDIPALRVQQFLAISSLDILFFISGFLFFQGFAGEKSFWKKWREKLARRVRSLLVPYLVWSAVALAWYAVAGGFPEGHSIGRSLALLRSFVGWNGWFSHPVGFALWYVKSLICFSVLSPLYWLVFRILGRASIVPAVFLAAFPPVPTDWPFFNSWLFLGGCLAWNRISPTRIANGFGSVLPLALAFLFGRQILAASGCTVPRFMGFAPILAWTCIFDALLSEDSPRFLSRIAPAASFVFFSHVLFSKIALAVMLKFVFGTGISEIGGIILFLSRTTITLVASLTFFFVLRRLSPKLLEFLTGSRY